MSDTKEKLFSEFPPISTEDWKEKVTADLKGVPFEKKLVWTTNEGFAVNALYRAEDIERWQRLDSLPGQFPYVRGTKKDNDWKIRQDVEVGDFKAANAQARDLLQKSVTSLGFHFAGKEVSAKNIAALLEGINPETVELNFKTCNRKAEELIGILSDYVARQGVDVNKCFGSVDYNPFKRPLAEGADVGDWVAQASAALKAGEGLPRYKMLAVDAWLLSDAGAYVAQELGYALAWGNELLGNLCEAGFAADVVAKNIKFNLGVGSNYFMEIAKFRAARWLWAQIVAAYQPQCRHDDCPNNQPDGLCRCACKMAIHARTSGWNVTVYDAHVNLLRTQTEAMSAAIGGVDSLTVNAFDAAYQTPDDFAKRIARNQQLLLKEEAHFNKVVDPAAGSYYIETLTHSLADVAWKLFLETEDKGGFYALIRSGEVQKAINASAVARKKAVATRREILLGTNQYPNFTETAAAKIKSATPTDGEKSPKEALDYSSRGADAFEALRLATERSGKTPKVFILTIGNLAMRLARAQFTGNFFACAGYHVLDNLGFDTVEDGVNAAVKAKADLVVLCSSDDEYAQFAVPTLKALNGRAELVIAGAPACADELKAQGITHFISIKSNVLETLQAFNEKLLK